ncbi:MAG: F0F1 ATP synthase subunit alpha [bacterium]|nr:F0F1 ATP synthase subunit alpha [bacterium]
MSYEIIEQLKKAISGRHDEPGWESVGKVLEVGDGVLRITGLKEAQSQEVLVVETHDGEVPVLVLNLEEEMIGALVLGEEHKIKSGDRVRLTGQVLSIRVGKELLGRVIDPLGNPLDGLGKIFNDEKAGTPYQLERKASSVLEREPVNTPLHTGIKSIDAMIPIGRGQRELIIGDRQTGKTAIALDAIINQQNDKGRERPVCIYVAIGQKESKIARIVATLKNAGALSYTIVVAAPASSPAASWYLAPFAGAAIGEYFMDQGKEALVVYDDLSKHAWGYRQISLLLNRPPGREAYPGDVFYLHSRLLERAAKMSKAKGGGSLTALPIIETQLGDISAYIPTNVISITDGQIFLESDLFYQGIRPAVNVGLSVSRVGSAAQTKAMKKIAGRLRLELAQFRELQAFAQFASDVDAATRAKLKRGEILTEILKQEDLAPLSVERQVVLLYAALNGYLDPLSTQQLGTVQAKLLEYMGKLHDKDVLAPLAENGVLDDALEAKLKAALASFDFNE